jgi:hypothetical protein
MNGRKKKKSEEIQAAVEQVRAVRNAVVHNQDIKPDQILFGGYSTEKNYKALSDLIDRSLITDLINDWVSEPSVPKEEYKQAVPPLNAEFLLYLFLDKNEREIVVGDFIESYSHVLSRFSKRRADLWFYKQVAGSLFPLLRRALLKVGAFVWLGRILRRLIS